MSTRSVTANLTIKFSGTNKLTRDDGSVVSTSHALNPAQGAIASGIGDNQADRLWGNATISLASGNSTVVDLYDLGSLDIGQGAGKDGLGLDFNNDELMTLIIQQVSGAGSLEAAPDASAGFPMGTYSVATNNALSASGVIVLHNPAGFNVVDGVRHRIRLTANGGPVVAAVILLGRSDDDESSSSSSTSTQSSSVSSSSSSQSTSSESSSSSPSSGSSSSTST